MKVALETIEIEHSINSDAGFTPESLNQRIISAGSPLEAEGHDRSDINLPENQLQLLQDVTNSVASES